MPKPAAKILVAMTSNGNTPENPINRHPIARRREDEDVVSASIRLGGSLWRRRRAMKGRTETKTARFVKATMERRRPAFVLYDQYVSQGRNEKRIVQPWQLEARIV
jgi:hypothetical protein